MKASRLISLLTEIIEIHGDLHLKMQDKLVYFQPYVDSLYSNDTEVPLIELGETYAD